MHKSTLSLVSLLALTACDPVTPDIETGFELSRFSSCEAMNDHLTESFVRSMTGYSMGWGMEDDIAMAGADDGDTSGAPSDYSTTNVQEASVDEPDMVKTDGEYVYVLDQGTLSIVKSWPAEQAEVVGQIDLDTYADKMFLRGDRIALYQNDWSEHEDGRWRAQTTIRVIDISDRTRPEIVSSKTLDGELVSARMIDSDIYTVLNHTISLPEDTYKDIWTEMDDTEYWMWDTSPAYRMLLKRRIENRIRPIIAGALDRLKVTDILPAVTHEDGSEDPLVGCTDVLHGSEASAPQLTTVAHLDMSSGDIKVSGDATSVMAGSTTVYASERNLYVAQSSNAWWDGFSEVERVTNIHRFTLKGADTRYAGSGQVDGYMHNQFSMSEYKGMLRVATTYSDWWWGTTTDDNRSGNNVFVLDIEQTQMTPIGSITGLAPGEQIYATRFQGDRAFMVTFVQIDPLFTIDLSQPTEPTAEGELKIPGYSAYLHPIGDDHILGVGMDGDWDGGINGVAISLFDVSDFSDPKQQDQITMECDSSWSEALWDHHAILVHNDTVAIPVYGWGMSGEGDREDDEGYYENTSGLMVASIDTSTGLTKTGFVDHSPLVEDVYCPEEKDCEESYMPQMRRSLMIEDYLFSISDLGIMVSTLDDPETAVAKVPLL